MQDSHKQLKPRTRLFVPDEIRAGSEIVLSEAQAHQLRHVLRLPDGAAIALFNGRDGEWLAEVTLEKRRILAKPLDRLRDQAQPADIWLAFAPIKHDRLSYLVEKASELGVARLLPVITARTQSARVNSAKLTETAREAAEQCERLTVPPVDEPCSLAALLQNWDSGRRLFLCAETGESTPAMTAFQDWNGPAALMTGPEGGFTPEEFELLRARDFAAPIGLGTLILRAETAAVAALACWQAATRSWGNSP